MFNVPNPTSASGRDPKPISVFYASPFCNLPNINFNIIRPSHSHVQTLNLPRTRYLCFLLFIQSSQLLFNCFHCVNISVAYTTLCEPRERNHGSVPGSDKRLISFLKQPDRL
jgi:hypothetical protein